MKITKTEFLGDKTLEKLKQVDIPKPEMDKVIEILKEMNDIYRSKCASYKTNEVAIEEYKKSLTKDMKMAIKYNKKIERSCHKVCRGNRIVRFIFG